MRVLVSVQSEAECQLALAAGVSMIDFKDPHTGALTMLDLAMTRRLCAQVRAATYTNNRHTLMLSATVGDLIPSQQYLYEAITDRMAAGVDIIKLPLVRCIDPEYQSTLQHLVAQGIRLIAVVAPNQWQHTTANSTVLQHLQYQKFMGVMMDTQDKSTSLTDQMALQSIEAFVHAAQAQQLFVGLAGGLALSDVPVLSAFKPDYLGFRGGLCEASQRNRALNLQRLQALMQNCRICA